MRRKGFRVQRGRGFPLLPRPLRLLPISEPQEIERKLFAYESLVNDILNPILGIIAGNNTALAAMAVELPGGGALMVGNFINAILNFLIMAFAVFCLVKALNRLHRKKEETPAPPPAPSQEELLLTEIRDLLKERT